MASDSLFPNPGTLVGMIHLRALPGTPRGTASPTAIVEAAVAEARLLRDLGIEGLIVENMGDRPYLLREVGPEIVATMTTAAAAVRREIPVLPLGIQVLAGANEHAMAIAHATGCDFVRVEGFAYSAVADEGLLVEASAGPLLRYRKAIGADDVRVFCDIHKKHSSHALTADLDLAEHARGALFCGADGVIVTGSATGEPTSAEDLQRAHVSPELPVLAGSGVTPRNAAELLPHAAAFIVGSSLKQDGRWVNPIDPPRVEALVAAVRGARG